MLIFEGKRQRIGSVVAEFLYIWFALFKWNETDSSGAEVIWRNGEWFLWIEWTLILNLCSLKGEHSWVCFGNTLFVKLPTEQSIKFIEDDMKIIDETVDSTREELKRRVNELRVMESQKDLEQLGFHLKSVC